MNEKTLVDLVYKISKPTFTYYRKQLKRELNKAEKNPKVIFDNLLDINMNCLLCFIINNFKWLDETLQNESKGQLKMDMTKLLSDFFADLVNEINKLSQRSQLH